MVLAVVENDGRDDQCAGAACLLHRPASPAAGQTE